MTTTARVRGWARIDEHVEHALGRQLETLGPHALALRCTLTLLGSARAPAERHAQLLSGFIAACVARPDALKHAAAALRRDLPKMVFCGGGESSDRVNAAIESWDCDHARSPGTLESLIVVGLPLPVIVHDAVIVRTTDEIIEGVGEGGRELGVAWARDLRTRLNIEKRAVDVFEAQSRQSMQPGAQLRARCVDAQLAAEAAAERRGISIFELAESGSSDAGLKTRLWAEHSLDSPHDPGHFEARRTTWPRWVARGEVIDVNVLVPGSLIARALESNAMPQERCR